MVIYTCPVCLAEERAAAKLDKPPICGMSHPPTEMEESK